MASEKIYELPAQERAKVLREHKEIRAAAHELGENIPALSDSEADIQEKVPIATADKSSAEDAKVIGEGDVTAVVEKASEGTLVFKFRSSANQSSATLSNRSNSKAMAVDPFSMRPAAIKKDASSVSNAEAVTYHFEVAPSKFKDAEESSPNAEVGKELDPPVAAEDKPVVSSKPRPARRAAANKTKPSKGSVKKVDPLLEARVAANAEVQSHSPASATADKGHWLYVTVPEKPMAGSTCMVYFNKAQSEPLRHRPRIQIHFRYNAWELEGEHERLDMAPVTEVPKSESTEFWGALLTIPEDAYELNFVVSDGESAFDNNSDQNFTIEVSGPMTKELWIDRAAERAEAAYLAHKEAERLEAERVAAEREAAAKLQDAELARQAVDNLINNYDAMRQGSLATGAPLWTVTPAKLVPGKAFTLSYDFSEGPLAHIPVPEDQAISLKMGHNGWQAPITLTMKRSAGSNDVWEAHSEVPEDAAVLNFVINYYEHYDNNHGNDYKIAVSLPATAESPKVWAEGLEDTILGRIEAERKAVEAQEAAIVARREATRKAAQLKAEEVRRRQMEHIFYTVPAQVRAGSDVTIHYNPGNTLLNGSERVFISGGYNRWRHTKKYGPIEMKPPGTGGQHFTAAVSVPKDAYGLDFVFSNAAEGTFDNNNGLDYHLPVKGSVITETPLSVCHIAVEMAPIAKVGGLGDVVTSLGRAVQEAGHNVEVILPRYDFFAHSPLLGDLRFETEFEWGGTRIWVSTCLVEGLRVFFIEAGNGMFNGPVYHGGQIDPGRFEFFSRAALEFLLRSGRQHDILHCHDWSTADVAKAYWEEYHHYGLWKPKVIFTIHNLNYGERKIGEAAYFSQRFTTVSPTYAWEIGGQPVIAPHNGKLKGIRNGIDIDIWDPETDSFLPKGYTPETVVEGKAAARDELRKRLGLTGWGEKPMVGVVTRLTKQKGTHLIAHSAFRTVDRGGQFVLLGSAPDPKVQAEFDALANQYGGENAAFCFAFDEPLSHLIYAACDFILVPSMFEPCGLTQMIAMRYGAVPIVRSTGGLHDTVFDVDADKARAAWELEGSTDWQNDGVDATNGFAFDGTDAGAMDYGLNRALDAWYNDRAWIHGLQRRVMEQDWSWNKPAIDYIQLYFAAMK